MLALVVSCSPQVAIRAIMQESQPRSLKPYCIWQRELYARYTNAQDADPTAGAHLPAGASSTFSSIRSLIQLYDPPAQAVPSLHILSCDLPLINTFCSGHFIGVQVAMFDGTMSTETSNQNPGLSRGERVLIYALTLSDLPQIYTLFIPLPYHSTILNIELQQPASIYIPTIPQHTPTRTSIGILQ
jgi:hypothetical protein